MTEKEFKAALKAKDKEIEHLRDQCREAHTDMGTLLHNLREIARITEGALSYYEHRNPDSVLCRRKREKR